MGDTMARGRIAMGGTMTANNGKGQQGDGQHNDSDGQYNDAAR